jgi:hypothetical protein
LQAKATEYKENATRALQPSITRLQMQHEQELADVERSLQVGACGVFTAVVL